MQAAALTRPPLPRIGAHEGGLCAPPTSSNPNHMFRSPSPNCPNKTCASRVQHALGRAGSSRCRRYCVIWELTFVSDRVVNNSVHKCASFSAIFFKHHLDDPTKKAVARNTTPRVAARRAPRAMWVAQNFVPCGAQIGTDVVDVWLGFGRNAVRSSSACPPSGCLGEVVPQGRIDGVVKRTVKKRTRQAAAILTKPHLTIHLRTQTRDNGHSKRIEFCVLPRARTASTAHRKQEHSESEKQRLYFGLAPISGNGKAMRRRPRASNDDASTWATNANW